MAEYVTVIVARDEDTMIPLVVFGVDQQVIDNQPDYLDQKVRETVKLYGPVNVKTAKIRLKDGWSHALFEDMITEGEVRLDGELRTAVDCCAQCPMKGVAMDDTYCTHPLANNQQIEHPTILPDWCPLNHASVRIALNDQE